MTTWTKEATDTTISSTATGQITASSLDVDNINIDGNTITVTNTNGNLILKPTGTGDITITGADGSTDSGALHLDGATNNMYWNSGADDFIFSFAAGLLYVDKANDRVGIQTTSPDAKLEVVGSFAANGPSSTFVTFADGDATPSVSTGNIFKHHASTQTINMFDGGVCGQIITVISTAAITYDFNASNLKCGSADVVTASGDVTMWVFDGTYWYLLSWMDVSANLADGSAGGF
jgi:hypothetical protein